MVRVELRLAEAPAFQDALSASEFQALPAVRNIATNTPCVAEIWLQETAGEPAGITGGSIDLRYTAARLQASALQHGSIFTNLPAGTIKQSSGLVDDLGGATFLRGQGTNGWVRLGYVQFKATQIGPATLELAPGIAQFSRFGRGNVEWADVILPAAMSVEILPAGQVPPSITVPPAAQTSSAGRTVLFTVQAAGSAPLSYRWQKDQTPLVDGGRVSGAATATLTLTGVESADAGLFSVVVTNAYGSVTSNPARLTITTSGELRLIASTGSQGPHPFSLVELRTNPAAEVLLGSTRYSPALDFSPEGELFSAGTDLRVVDPANGEVRRTIGSLRSAEESSLLANSIAFAPDGRLYAVTSDTLYQVDPTTAFATKIGAIEGTHVWGIDFAPDGTLYGAQFDLVVLDPATARVLSTVGKLTQFVVDIDYAADGAIYAIGGAHQELIRINPNTAAAVILGAYESALWGIASQGGEILPSPPVITIQPQPVATNPGATVSFGVSASGDTPLSYQWRFNDIPLADGARISGVNTPTLTLANVQNSDAGFYTVVVTNPNGSITSAQARLTVTGETPSGEFRLLASTGSGGTNSFALVELRTNPVEEVLLGTGRYHTTLDFSPAGELFGASSELRVIDPSNGSVKRTVGTLHTAQTSFLNVRSIAFAPDGRLFAVASDLLYQVDPTTALATEVGPIEGAYVWGIDFAPDGTLYGAEFDLVVLDPSTGRVLSKVGRLSQDVVDIDYAPDGAIYGVRYSTRQLFRINPANAEILVLGTYLSPIWGVASEGGGAVLTPPAITLQPQPATANVGAAVSFTVSASGSEPLSYQWSRAGQPLSDGDRLSGTGSATLRIDPVQAGDAGSYTVRVSNGGGSAQSTPAMLTVLPAEAPGDYVIHFTFSGDAQNSGGAGCHGTVHGARLTNGRSGAAGGAFLFNGSSDFIDCGSCPALDYLTNFTLTVWIRPEQGNTFRPILSKQTVDCAGNGRAEFNLQIQNNGNLNFFMGDGGGGHSYGVLLNGGILPAQTWAHVAVTFSNRTVTLYLNGRAKATGVFSAAVRPFGTLPLQIGRFCNGLEQFFYGTIDEVSVFNRALTPAEVLTIAEAPATETQSLRLAIQAVNNVVQLTIAAELGTRCIVQVTDALGQPWRPAATLTIAQPFQVWIDPDPATHPTRFYRLIIPQ